MSLRSIPGVERGRATIDGLPQQGLSHQLREETRSDHARAEATFAMGDWSSSRHRYQALLTVLLSFYGPAERRLRMGHDWERLCPRIDVRARERAHLLTRDLARLGVEADRPVVASARVDPLTTGLGWLYVLEGSRLGGAFIARAATASLGEDLPVAFFSSDGRRARPDWHELQQSLDSFGARAEPMERAQVVASARLAFASFTECVSPKVVSR